VSKIISFSKPNPRNALNRAKNLNPIGPSIEDSQAISSQNARIPYLATLQAEDHQEFTSLHDNLLREYRPVNITERLLVQMIAQNQSMLARVRRRESMALSADPSMSAIKSFLVLQSCASHYQRMLCKDIEVLRKLQTGRVRTPLPPDPPPAPPSPVPKTPLRVVPKGIYSVSSEPEDGRFSTRPTPIRTPRPRRLPEKKVA
jgi:hypothetical protein